MQANQLQHTVFLHHDLYVTPSLWGTGFGAENDILADTLLLIEHVFAAEQNVLEHYLVRNQSMYRRLYPRRPADFIAPTRQENSVFEKLLANVFSFSHKRHILASAASNFNHQCDPNAVYVTWEDSGFIYICVFTTKAVTRGQEICVSYGPRTGHESTGHKEILPCDCGIDLQTRTKRHEECLQSAISKIPLQTLVDYQLSQDAVKLLVFQDLARYGFLLCDAGREISVSSSFRDGVISERLTCLFHIISCENNIRNWKTFLEKEIWPIWFLQEYVGNGFPRPIVKIEF